MQVGDIYKPKGNEFGIILKLETIQAEYGLYQVVTYRPAREFTAQTYPERWNVHRLSDGPDLFLGGTNISWGPDRNLYTWTLSEESIYLIDGVDRSDKARKTPEEIIQILINLSEKELEKAYKALYTDQTEKTAFTIGTGPNARTFYGTITQDFYQYSPFA